MSRRLILAALLISFASALAAAETDYIIPATASLDGALGSHWQTEVTLFNSSSSDMALALTFSDGTGKVATRSLTLAPRTTTSVGDIVRNTFGLTSALGAIAIDVTDDALVDNLVVSSRTFNVSAAGEFGQDVPAVPASGVITKGYSAIVTGPSDVSTVRFNFGIYAAADSSIRWKLLRKDGTVAKEVTTDYNAFTHAQYSPGVERLFETSPANNDVIQADVLAGAVVLYGSIVNNATGDPTFVPAGRTREPAPIEVLGVDLDENGTVDIQAHDGVLDRPVALTTSLYPNFFRVVAVEKTSTAPLTYTLVNPSRDVALVDSEGTIQWAPGADVRGTSSSLTVRISDGFHSTDLLIPVIFE